MQTASDQAETAVRIQFDFVGKARLTVKNAAGNTVFQNEYNSDTTASRTIRVEVGYQLNQAYTINLELAADSVDAPARNTVFAVSWGEAERTWQAVLRRPGLTRGF